MQRTSFGLFALGLLLFSFGAPTAAAASDDVSSSIYMGILTRAGYAEDPESLIQALEEENIILRCCAVQVLGMLKVTAAIPKLRDMLDDRLPGLRLYAAEALGRMGDESAIPVLRDLLDDPDDYTVLRAAEVLAIFGDETGLPRIKCQLASPNRWDRRMAVNAFGHSRNPSVALPVLSAALMDTDRHVRLRAMIILKERATPEAIDLLGTVLYSGNRDERYRAALLLNQTKRKEVIPHLIGALTDSDADVRRVAALGLTYLAGRKISPRTKARVRDLKSAELVQKEWQQWWNENGAKYGVPELGAPQFDDAVLQPS